MTLGYMAESERLSVSFGSDEIAVSWWRGELLRSPFSLDTETVVFAEDDPAPCPELVLATAFDGDVAYLIGRDAISELLLSHAASDVVVHNVGFDFWVLERWLLKRGELEAHTVLWRLAAERLHDTSLLDRLLRLASPTEVQAVARRRSLAELARDLLDVHLPKDSLLRRSFGDLLRGGTVDYSLLSREGATYAVMDAVATFRVFEQQGPRAHALLHAHKGSLLPEALRRFGLLSETIQVRGAIALAEIMRRGLAVDVEAASALQTSLRLERDRWGEALERAGVVQRTGSGWRKCTTALKSCLRLAAERLGRGHGQQLELLPLNPSGTDVSMRGRDWKEWGADEFLDAWLNYERATKLLNTFVKALGARKQISHHLCVRGLIT